MTDSKAIDPARVLARVKEVLLIEANAVTGLLEQLDRQMVLEQRAAPVLDA